MLNQYVNLTPQQKMAQMLQQQAQQTPLQGGQQEMPQSMGQAAQNPFGGAADAMKMYNQANQQNDMQDYKDYIARLKLGQTQTGGMFDSANAGGGGYTANNGT